MKTKTICKSLLVAAGLLVGSSAWAGDKTVVKYSFDDALSPSLTAGSRVSFDYDKTSVITSTKFLNAFNNTNGDPGSSTVSLGSTDLSGENWTLSFEWAAVGGCNKKADHTTLKAGDTNLFDLTGDSNWNTTVTITYTGSDGTKKLPVPGCDKGKRFTAGTGDQLNTTVYWHHIVVTGSASGVKMTITNSNSGTAVVEDIVLSETNVNPTQLNIEPCCGGAIGIDELLLSYAVEGEVIQTPIAAITAVNGIERTVTATCETEGAVISYSLDEGANYTDGASVTVDADCTIWFKATKGESESDILEFPVEAGTEINLHAPTINRTSNTSVTITANQSDLLLSPTATIYYSYNGSDYAAYTLGSTITVAADATISAYATATGYTNSATTTRAVALFPTAGITQVENAVRSNHTAHTLTDEAETVSDRNYAALKLDDSRWGTKIKMQTAGWEPRPNNTWYVSAAQGTYAYILMPNMKAGDIIVADIDAAAKDVVNATYSEKYSIGNQFAYIVNANGNVELGFERISSSINNYVRGFYAYTHNVTGTAIGATDCSTAWKAATTTPVTLKPGDSYRYQFINYNNGANINDQNWQLIVANAANSADLLQIRADWYENLHGSTVAEHQRGFTSDGDWWSIVPSKMNGAEVDMTVTFTADKKFVMTSTTTGSDGTTTRTYNYTSDNANSIDLTANDALTVYLTVAKNWLDIKAENQTAVGITPANDNSTYCSAYDLDFSGVDGLKAYIAASDKEESSINLSSVDQIKAEEGMVLVGTAGTTYSVPVTTGVAAPAKNYMKGVLVDTPLDANSCYILGTDGDFHPVSGGTLAAGKAYLDISPSGAKSLTILFDNETLGISDATLLNKNAEGMGEKTIYNLSGQRIAAPQKGINIIGGRKVVVK